MRILFYGDSITDAQRTVGRQGDTTCPYGLGTGYVNPIASELVYSDPNKFEVINTGISGNRVVDLYSRIKVDCWNYQPDVISILIGVNDVWHEVQRENGVEIDRFENVYRMLIEDTKKALPNVKLMLLEPFVQKGEATAEKYDEFLRTLEYAKVVKKLAQEFDLPFVALQKPLDDYAKKFGAEKTLIDGVHPAIAGARVITNEWLKVFNEKILK